MPFKWGGGSSGGTLPDETFVLRYNVFYETPIGEYHPNGQTNYMHRRVYRTRYEYRTGSLKAYINGQPVIVNESAGVGAIEHEDFLIDNTAPSGILYIEYLPLDTTLYYTNQPYKTEWPTRCENRSTHISLTLLTTIQNAIVRIERHMANRDESYLYTNKIQFLRDNNTNASVLTREELEQYQKSVQQLRYLLDRTVGIETPLHITPIAEDNSYYLKDQYIYELRIALHTLDKQYGIVD